MKNISARLSDGGVQNNFLRVLAWLTFPVVIAVHFFSHDSDLKLAMTLFGLIGLLVLLESYGGRVRTVEILAEEEVAPLEEKWSTVYLVEVQNGHAIFRGKTLEVAVDAVEKARQEFQNAWSGAAREWNSFGKWKKKMLAFRNLDEREFCRNYTGDSRRNLLQAQARWEGLMAVEGIIKLVMRDLEKD